MTGATRATGRRRLSRRVALLVGAGVALPMLVVGAIDARAVASLTRAIGQERQALATSVAGRVDQALQANLTALASVAAAPHFDLADGDPAPERAALHAAWLRSRMLETVFLLDAAGTPVAEEPPREPAALVALPASLEQARRAGRPFVGDLAQAPDGRRRVLVVLPAIDWRGEVAGFAAGILDPASPPWSALLGPHRESGPVDLVDGRGALLASTDPTRLGTPSPPPGGGIEAPLTACRWRVLVRVPEAEAAATLGRIRQLLWVAPLLLGLALLLGWGAARSVTQPLSVLAQAARRIADGAIAEPIPPLGEDEVGRLGQSLEDMRRALERSFLEVRTMNRELEARVAERTRELRVLYEQLQEHDRSRGLLLRKVIGAQEEERKRIARELHDETCQVLTALVLAVDRSLQEPSVAQLAPRFTEVKSLATRALGGVHDLIFDLRPSVLDDLGLLPAIRWLASRLLVPRGLSVRCEFDELAPRLPPESETALFRAVQEALINVARHAGADSVLVQIGERGGELVIEIEDDGDGFDPASVAAAEPGGRGLGLLGLRERVELLGGAATIDSAPGEGTRVTLRVPLPAAEARA